MAATERTKRIFISDFISDVHIGDEESVSSFESNGLYPYCWFYDDRPQMLADFLQLQIEDPQVKAIVILGERHKILASGCSPLRAIQTALTG